MRRQQAYEEVDMDAITEINNRNGLRRSLSILFQ